jgi:hypothetical protein
MCGNFQVTQRMKTFFPYKFIIISKHFSKNLVDNLIVTTIKSINYNVVQLKRQIMLMLF